MSDNTPLVSVVIPVYNGEKFLKETIQSVIQQTFQSFEILIVDDGSTDNSWAIANQLAEQDSRVSLIRKKNQGVSVARNVGYRNSRGFYLAFLDADDVWLPGNLDVKIDKFGKGDFGLVHSSAQIIDETGRVVADKVICGREGNLLHDLLAWEETQVPGPSSMLVKREVLENVGLFDEDLSTSADQDFFIRVSARYQIGCVDKITWKYRMHGNNMHQDIARMEKDVIKVFTKVRHAQLFTDRWEERKCFANMYLVLAASWAGDGKNWKRGMYFTLKAMSTNPFLIFKLRSRIF